MFSGWLVVCWQNNDCALTYLQVSNNERRNFDCSRGDMMENNKIKQVERGNLTRIALFTTVVCVRTYIEAVWWFKIIKSFKF